MDILDSNLLLNSYIKNTYDISNLNVENMEKNQIIRLMPKNHIRYDSKTLK